MTNIFRKYKRVWCANDCGNRVLLTRDAQNRGELCTPCWVKAWEQDAKDQEMRSLRGASDAQMERF